jgi:hypothetical protein
MWECTKCHESIEDSFEVCWNCGTSREGVEDPSFQKAEDAEVASSAEAMEFDNVGKTASRIPSAVVSRCPHCGGVELIRALRLGQSNEVGDIGPSYRTLLVFTLAEPLYADLCKTCGSVARLYIQETDRDWIKE